jgi:hypothetical protein
LRIHIPIGCLLIYTISIACCLLWFAPVAAQPLREELNAKQLQVVEQVRASLKVQAKLHHDIAYTYHYRVNATDIDIQYKRKGDKFWFGALYRGKAYTEEKPAYSEAIEAYWDGSRGMRRIRFGMVTEIHKSEDASGVGTHPFEMVLSVLGRHFELTTAPANWKSILTSVEVTDDRFVDLKIEVESPVRGVYTCRLDRKKQFLPVRSLWKPEVGRLIGDMRTVEYVEKSIRGTPMFIPVVIIVQGMNIYEYRLDVSSIRVADEVKTSPAWMTVYPSEVVMNPTEKSVPRTRNVNWVPTPQTISFPFSVLLEQEQRGVKSNATAWPIPVGNPNEPDQRNLGKGPPALPAQINSSWGNAVALTGVAILVVSLSFYVYRRGSHAT